MPRLSPTSFPSYRKHKPSGQAVVTLNGKDHYLGTWDTSTSKKLYDRKIKEWLANDRRLPSEAKKADLTIAELMAAYRRYARAYYRKGGRITREADIIDEALAHLKLYAREPVVEFGPTRLKVVRKGMIDDGWCRKYINKQVSRIRRMFRWGVAEELIPDSVHSALKKLPDLRKGRTNVPDRSPVLPVDEAVVQATLPHLSQIVADMIRLQRLTGMRPEEVCQLRPRDLDRSADVWLYHLASHKTEHMGRSRVVSIGPKGQDVLHPYLLRGADEFCFSPVEAEGRRRAAKHEARKTPLQYGNRPGTNRKENPRRPAGRRYTTPSYRRAIHRAVEVENAIREKAGRKDLLPKWSPNRLRHSAATEIRRKYGLEGAQVVLGHAQADVTQIYAERDLARAAEIMREVG